MKEKESQEKKIAEHLLEGNTITPIEALEKWGCFRLGARIYNLIKKGYNIQSETVSRNGKHFAQYSLISE